MNLQERIERLLAEVGFDKLPAGRQPHMMEQIYGALNDRIGLRFAESMTEEQMTQFNRLAEKNDGSAIDALKEMFPDYEEVVLEEVDNLKDDIKLLMPSTSEE